MAKARKIAAILNENDDQHPDDAEAEIDYMVNPVIPDEDPQCTLTPCPGQTISTHVRV